MTSYLSFPGARKAPPHGGVVVGGAVSPVFREVPTEVGARLAPVQSPQPTSARQIQGVSYLLFQSEIVYAHCIYLCKEISNSY